MKQESFGKLLQRKRIERGIGLRQFAKDVGIAAPYLSDIENGNRPAPENTVPDRIAKLLFISVEEQRCVYDLVSKRKWSVRIGNHD